MARKMRETAAWDVAAELLSCAGFWLRCSPLLLLFHPPADLGAPAPTVSRVACWSRHWHAQ